MEPIIAEYLVDKLVDDIRSTRPLPSQLCQALFRYPIINDLRRRINPDDFLIIHSLCESDDDAVRNLGFALLQNIRQERVRCYLEEVWQRPLLSFKLRTNLQAELLNYPELSQDYHEQLFRFTLDNWQPWLQGIVDWCGGGEGVLKYCTGRLSDPKFPKSKRWLYVCAAAASNDLAAARNLIGSYVEDPDPFLRGVPREVLKRL